MRGDFLSATNVIIHSFIFIIFGVGWGERGVGGGPSTMRSKFNKFEHVQGRPMALYRGWSRDQGWGPEQGFRGQTYMTENIAFATPFVGAIMA